jgi:hypothetical protein
MLFVSRSGLVEENAVKVFHHWCSLVLFFLDVKFEVLSGKIIMRYYSRFLSTSTCRVPICGSSTFKDSFP